MSDELERFRLDGRVAVVSGGSGGIGARLCAALAGVGARLVVIGRNRERASAALDAAGGDGIAVAADVTNKQDSDDAIDAAMQAFGRVDVIINAVGAVRWTRPRSTRSPSGTGCSTSTCARRCCRPRPRCGR